MIGAIILARMDSSRLPGKPLYRVGNRPLIDFVWERLRRTKCLNGRVVLATSGRDIDDPLEQYAAGETTGLACFRGDLDDVAGRFLACARENQWDYAFRVNGDSPHIEPALFDQAAAMIETQPFDLVTNLVPRSFPYGVSVELVRTAALATAYARMTRPDHFEHVTKYLYENLADFRYANIDCPEGNLHHVRLTVDTAEDFRKHERLAEAHRQDFDRLSYIEVMRFLDQGGRSP